MTRDDTRRTRSADGVAIAYDVRGDGPALVLVHGWAGRRGHWDEQVDACSSSSTVVRLDLAGHGASGRGRARWTVSAFADDVVAVVETLALGDLVLVGHSLGGSVIALAAPRLGPRVRGLVGVDTWSSIGVRLEPSEIERSVFLPDMRADFAVGSRRFAELMCGPTTPRPLLERITAETASMPPDIAVAILDTAIAAGPDEIERALRDLAVPKTAIASETFRPKDPATLAAFGIDHVVIPRTGHYLMLERPSEFNEHLARTVAAMFAANPG
jgi:pimeloyl-ACP methyl ester carboxylesterase